MQAMALPASNARYGSTACTADGLQNTTQWTPDSKTAGSFLIAEDRRVAYAVASVTRAPSLRRPSPRMGRAPRRCMAPAVAGPTAASRAALILSPSICSARARRQNDETP